MMNFYESKSNEKRKTSTQRSDRWMIRLFEQGLYSDVTFVVDERIFPLHRCVLAARSSFFQEAFETRWYGKREIKLPHARVTLFVGCSMVFLKHRSL